MNAPVETVTLKIGDGTLIVPAEGLARLWLDQQLGGTLHAELDTTRVDASLAIGEELLGQIYAGLTLHNNAPHRLFLMPGELESGTWKEALKWAANQGGGDCVLPSRIDALVLLQYLKKEFKDAWYWTSEPYAHNADYAWVQDFTNGTQGYDHTSDRCRARAVRRVPI